MYIYVETEIDKERETKRDRQTLIEISTAGQTLIKISTAEYKAKHDWVGKVIHWEMCKKFKFDHTNKLYMHNPASVLENAMHKLLWDFNIQTDHLIPARRPDLIIINKKEKRTCKIVDFTVPAKHRIKLK